MLCKEGIQKGERIGVISSNCHMHPELLFTAAKGGWVLAEIDHRLSKKEIEHIIEDSEPRILFFEKDLEDVIPDIPNQYPELKTIRFPDHYNNILSSFPTHEPVTEVDEDDSITLMYTSGTTGHQRGVIYTHKNLMASIMNFATVLQVGDDDITLHTSPFSHVAPIWPFLLHSYYGGSNVIIKNLDPGHILETIHREKITTWNTVPMVISRVLDLKEKEKFDVTSLRWITYGASPIPLPVLRKALMFFGNILNQVYGCTETYAITFFRADDHNLQGSDKELKRLSSCGLEMTNTETIVVKPDGSRIKPGETGEVITRGDHVSPGYWREKTETRGIKKKGWFYTGDLATIDEDGFLYITGRRKEIIVTGGENVAPKELENVLYSHDAVKETAVIGLPHKAWGEAVTAFVILHHGKRVSEDDLIAFSRERLTGYKCPKGVIFLEDFPRTTSGKILKRKLRDLYEGRYD
jgi:acyl-CoA synthetase (AMP-forming)/AMP-acid ligase II